jgi:hypothetical protein
MNVTGETRSRVCSTQIVVISAMEKANDIRRLRLGIMSDVGAITRRTDVSSFTKGLVTEAMGLFECRALSKPRA